MDCGILPSVPNKKTGLPHLMGKYWCLLRLSRHYREPAKLLDKKISSGTNGPLPFLPPSKIKLYFFISERLTGNVTCLSMARKQDRIREVMIHSLLTLLHC